MHLPKSEVIKLTVSPALRACKLLTRAFLNISTKLTVAITLAGLRGNEAAQDAQLVQLEAKLFTHPRT